MNFFFFFIFACAAVYASVNEPLRIEYFSGYRNDRIHWHLQNPGYDNTSYTELYRNVQFWENGVDFKVIHRDVAFLARGSFSAFGRGELFQHYFNVPAAEDNPQFQASTSGWAADATGYLSYVVNLTAARHYKWIVMPLLGYSGHFERLSRSEVTPDPLSTGSYQITSSFPQMLRQTWYGVFLGVNFLIETGGRLVFNVGYTYHWLRTRFNTQWQNQSLFSEGSPPITTNSSLHVNEGGNLGQTGWAQADFLLAKGWRLGFGAQIHYFSTSFIPLNIKENGVSIPQTFKLRWTPIDGWFQISREI